MGSRMGGMSHRSLTSKQLGESRPGQKRFDPNQRRLKKQASDVDSELSRNKVVKKQDSRLEFNDKLVEADFKEINEKEIKKLLREEQKTTENVENSEVE